MNVRAGGPADASTVLSLLDEAVTWLVARGQPDQWGDQPFSSRRESVTRIRVLCARGRVRVAESAGEPVGALVLGDAPDHVPPIDEPELYIQLLVTSRRHAGRGIGARLIEVALAEAAADGVDRLRVDCWAGAPGLVDWYRRQGFAPAGGFELNGWPGQILARAVPPA